MSLIQSIKRVFIPGPVFEVLLNKNGQWFVHKRSTNGQVEDVTESYATKSNAIRAAMTRAANTKAATWKLIPTSEP